MNSDVSLALFFGLDPKQIGNPVKKLEAIEETSTELLELKDEEQKLAQEERRRENRSLDREEQRIKRGGLDRLNFIKKIFGTKEEKKKEAGGINKWLMAGLGLGVLGAGFLKYKDQIVEDMQKFADKIGKMIKGLIDSAIEAGKKKLGEALEDAKNSLFTWTENALSDLFGWAKDIVFGEEKVTAGSAYQGQQNKINERLSASGLDAEGNTEDGSERTAEQERAFQEAQEQRKSLQKKKDAYDADVKAAKESKSSSGRSRAKSRKTKIKRIENEFIENITIKKQQGGPIDVPGYGTGDKVPMLLPSGSFVLNKNAARMLQNGGEVGIATKHIKKDEALSSLTAGMNDWIREGGRSVRSGTPWNEVKNSTPLHAYMDSVGQPTIGWGSTYYDNISSGKDPVRMGDTITKSKADKVLNSNVNALKTRYSNEIPNWGKMSDKQRASLLSMGYNAPNFFSSKSFAPRLQGALKRGDTNAIAANLSWGGPSRSRIQESQAMFKQGPKNLATAPVRANAPKVKEKPKTSSWSWNPMSWFDKKQTGGEVGRNISAASPKHMERFEEAQGKIFDVMGNQTSQSVVIVKRSTPPATPPAESSSQIPSSGSELNTVEISQRFHRLRSGSSY